MTLDKISNLVERKLECPRFPAHTQAVERLIQEITQACGSFAGGWHDSHKNIFTSSRGQIEVVFQMKWPNEVAKLKGPNEVVRTKKNSV